VSRTAFDYDQSDSERAMAAAFGKAFYQVCGIVSALLATLGIFHVLQNEGKWLLIAEALGAAAAIFLLGYGVRHVLTRSAPTR
jgi:hypothetical protein